MNREDLNSPVAAAATAQVKLCPYDEKELHIWFQLIEARFAAAGIKSQKLKYANALASLPKQVLRDILDTLDVCSDSDELFDFLKNTLLGQFGKSLWRAGYIPGDRLTSWVYPTTCVQYLYISCYLSDNKPVLSCLLSCLLPQMLEFLKHKIYQVPSGDQVNRGYEVCKIKCPRQGHFPSCRPIVPGTWDMGLSIQGLLVTGSLVSGSRKLVPFHKLTPPRWAGEGGRGIHNNRQSN
jgi:hypothetical protein